MSLQLPYSIQLTNSVPVDYYYGPYSTLANAISAVPHVVRYAGLTVYIIGDSEYWWTTDLTDGGLQKKFLGGGTGSTGGSITGITAGGDLYGTYPNPSVSWINSYSTLDNRYLQLTTPVLTNGGNSFGQDYIIGSTDNYPVFIQLDGTKYISIYGSGTIGSFSGSWDIYPDGSASFATNTFNISNSGVITNGTWNGQVIIDAYISSASVWNAKQDALSGTSTQFVKGDGSYDSTLYVPISGTISGQPISGDIEFDYNEQPNLVVDSVGDNVRNYLNLAKTGITIGASTYDNSLLTYISFKIDRFEISSTNTSFSGLYYNNDFSSNFTSGSIVNLGFSDNRYLRYIVPSTDGLVLTSDSSQPYGISWSIASSGLLTGYISGSGTISPTDSILSAIQKLNGNIALVSGAIVYQGLWDASMNNPMLQSGIGVTGYMYKVSVAGNTVLDGITSWNIGDQAIFDGTTWDKLDGISTEVLSVNGLVGAVPLVGTTGQIDITSGNVFSIDPNFQYSITGVGTISQGIWNGTPITDQYINSTNPYGYITGITGQDVINAINYPAQTGITSPNFVLAYPPSNAVLDNINTYNGRYMMYRATNYTYNCTEIGNFSGPNSGMFRVTLNPDESASSIPGYGPAMNTYLANYSCWGFTKDVWYRISEEHSVGLGYFWPNVYVEMKQSSTTGFWYLRINNNYTAQTFNVIVDFITQPWIFNPTSAQYIDNVVPLTAGLGINYNWLQNTVPSIYYSGTNYFQGGFVITQSITNNVGVASIQNSLYPTANNQVLYGLSYVSGFGAGTGFLTATLTTPGSGYNPGTYTGVALVNITGTGSGAIATVVVNSSGAISYVTQTTGGTGYATGNTFTLTTGFDGGASTNFVGTVATLGYTGVGYAEAQFGGPIYLSNIVSPPYPANGFIWNASNHIYARSLGVTYQLDLYNATLTPTANSQNLVSAVISPSLTAGTGFLTATLTTPGSGFNNGTYTNVALVNITGTGSGAIATVVVSGNSVTSVTQTTGGTGYAVNNQFTFNIGFDRGTSFGFVGTVATIGYNTITYTSAQFGAAPVLFNTITTPTNLLNGHMWSASNHLYMMLNSVTYQIDQPTVVGTITTGTWTATAIGAIYGGTAQTTYTTGDILYASATNTLAKRAIGTTGNVLSVVGGVPTWAALNLAGGSAFVSGILPAANGGTGIGTYTVGAILYANTTTTLSTLADVATGSYLVSGGVNTAPAWSAVTLPNAATTGDIIYATASNTFGRLADVAVGSYLRSGGVGVVPVWSTVTLPNAATTGDIIYASATNTYSSLADVATGNALISGGVGAIPSWGKISLTTTVSGILPPANGGTGVNNGTFTITLGGNFTTTGAFNLTLAVPQTTTYTLPNTANETLAGLGTVQTFTKVNTFSPPVTSSAGSATAMYLTPTLTAAANNDNLVGLSINPTRIPGSFTGLTFADVQASFLAPLSNNTGSVGNSNYAYSSIYVSTLFGGAGNNVKIQTGAAILFNISNTTYAQVIQSTGNFMIQNGGTYNDSGQRLQVVGTSLFNGASTFVANGITGVSTDEIIVQNSTLSTSGSPIQWSPRVRFSGHAWNTTVTAADNYLDIIEELQTVSGTSTYGNLTWSGRNSTGGTGPYTQLMTLSTTGNLTIGDWLWSGVNNQQQITSLVSQESGVYSVNLLTSSGWTSTGWSGSFSTGFTNNASNTTPLSNSLAAIVAGVYQIVVTITGYSAGTVTPSFGGVPGSALSGNGGFQYILLAISTANFTLTPTSTFVGTVTITLESIGVSTAPLTITSSNSKNYFEVRGDTTGDSIYLGSSAGGRSFSGYAYYNSFFGYQAGFNNVIGAYSVYLGYQAGYSNLINSYNTFIGYQAGYGSQVANSSTYIGYSAGKAGGGLGSTLVGSGSGTSVIGTYNTFLGINTGAYLTSGNSNTLIGGNAGLYTGTGVSQLTSLNNSIFIGYNSRAANATGDTNEVVIGYNQVGYGSNTTIIGTTGSTTQTYLAGTLNMPIGYGIGSTSTDSIILENNLLTTGITIPVQWSSRQRFSGHGWNTTSNTDNKVDFIIENQIMSGTGVTGVLVHSAQVNGGGYAPISAQTSSGLFGLGTTNPTHTLTLGSTTSGISIYNTADQTTNYERFVTYWTGNQLQMGTQAGGSGSYRTFQLFSQNSALTINPGYNAYGAITASRNINGGNGSVFGIQSTFGASSGTSNGISITPTINQTGTSSANVFWISPYNQLLGTGTNFLVNFGTNTAANGAGTHTSVFTLNMTGTVNSYINSITNISTDGIVLQNGTATTGPSSPFQWSPRQRLSAHVWDFIASSDKEIDFITEIQAITGVGASYGNYVISSQYGLTGYSSVLSISSGVSANLTPAMTFTPTVNVIANNQYMIGAYLNPTYNVGSYSGTTTIDLLVPNKIYFGNTGVLRGFIGRPSWNNSYIAIQNASLSDSSSNAALTQDSSGNTVVNSAPNKTLYLQVGNGNGFTITNASASLAPSSVLNVWSYNNQTTSTDVFTIGNNTATTGVTTPAQWSGRTRNYAYAWNTTSSANNQIDFIQELQSLSGTSPSGNFVWSGRVSASGTGAFTSLMTLTTGGYLGINITPSAGLHVKGTDSSSSNYAFRVDSSTVNNLLTVRDDGPINIGNSTNYYANINIGGVTTTLAHIYLSPLSSAFTGTINDGMLWYQDVSSVPRLRFGKGTAGVTDIITTLANQDFTNTYGSKAAEFNINGDLTNARFVTPYGAGSTYSSFTTGVTGLTDLWAGAAWNGSFILNGSTNQVNPQLATGSVYNILGFITIATPSSLGTSITFNLYLGGLSGTVIATATIPVNSTLSINTTYQLKYLGVLVVVTSTSVQFTGEMSVTGTAITVTFSSAGYSPVTGLTLSVISLQGSFTSTQTIGGGAACTIVSLPGANLFPVI